MKVIFNISCMLLIIFTYGNARIINVPSEIDSIQGGINLADNGDTVLVEPGTYVENINLNGKNIVVGSLTLTTGDTSFISRTVIDGSQPSELKNQPVVKIGSGEDSTAVISGFTLTNGYGLYGSGLALINSSPTISYMRIVNNQTSGDLWGGWGGGGIHFDKSNARLSYITVKSNRAANGGGIYMIESNPILTNVDISENSGDLDGGGLSCRNSSPTFINSTITNNESVIGHWDIACGGGVSLYCSNAIFVNVIIRNNTATAGGGVWCVLSNPSFSNVTITGNFAESNGGVVFDNSNPKFDENNRSSIYQNYASDAPLGQDLICSGDSVITVFLDTFTVLNPDSSQAYPLNKFTFDILHAAVTNISDNPISLTNFVLSQNYPNPFNPSTKIKFDLPKPESVKIEFYNIIGQKIETLLNKPLPAGYHEVEFNGQNLSSGIYLYRIKAGTWQDVKKMILLR